MHILGIIAEYNPFHSGHLYQLKQARKLSGCDGVLVLMSGDAVQRGGFADFNKRFRAKLALESGADLVAELPYMAAGQSAEYFAEGAVRILQAAGVESLSFGCETNDAAALKEAAALLANENEAFKTALREALASGQSFPRARQTVFDRLAPALSPLLSSPNDLLGLEYLKAANRLSWNAEIFPIKRLGAGYHDTSVSGGEYPSATAVRKCLLEKKPLPAGLPYKPVRLRTHYKPADERLVFHALCSKLITADTRTLSLIAGVGEGLENKLLDIPAQTQNMTQAYEFIKSKRITHAAVRRLLMNILMDFHKDDLNLFRSSNAEPYLHVLGFNERGRSMLGEISESIPTIINGGRDSKKLSPTARHTFDLDVRASDMRTLFSADGTMRADYLEKPILLYT